jgi:hypothetical protein
VPARSWIWDEEAKLDRKLAVDALDLARRSTYAELFAGLDYVAAIGEHPHELPRRGAVRAFPAVVHGDAAVYIVFATTSGRHRLVVLHVVLERLIATGAATSQGTRPSLSERAWNLGRSRLDSGVW